MADISVERKSGGITWLWALLAVAAVIGLMFWLLGQSRDLETAALMQADSIAAAEAEPEEASGEVVELSALAATPDAFAGRTLQVTGVPVAATIGSRAFWGDVPGQNPFLVVFAPAVASDAVTAGNSYDVVGTVQAVDDAVLSEWVASGALGEAQRDEASFATHALVAEQATPAGGLE